MSLDHQNDQDYPSELTDEVYEDDQLEDFEYYEEPQEAPKPFWVRHRTILLLIVILIGAAFFRFIGRNFDQSTNQHPDERAIIDATRSVHWPSSLSELFDPKTSPLNLRSNIACGNAQQGCEYPWGSLPVYLARAGAWVLDSVVPPTVDHPKGYYLDDWNAQQQVGRTLASIFDLITVFLVFLIARRLYSSATALIATALVAFAVTEIQIAHYYISEPFLVCFMMGALYFSVVLMQKPSWWAAAGAGACLGFAVASKVTIAFFGLIIIAAIVLRAAYRMKSRMLGAELGDPVGLRPADAEERNRSFGGHLRRGLRYFLIAALFTLIAFSISEPYALWQFDFTPLQQGAAGASVGDNIKAVLDTNPWTRRIAGEAAIQSGEADIPYTRQYIGTVPVLYHFEQLVLWGMGVIPGLIGVAGILAAIWLAIRRKPAEILLLAGAIPYFLTIAGLESKWMRYMLPLVPIVAILGAAFLVRGARWTRERYAAAPSEPRIGLRSLQRNFFAILIVAAIGFAFLWTLAFSNIYFQDHSRVQASAWIYDNVPDGASISAEGWDDSLPLGLPTRPGEEPRGYGDRGYHQVSFNLYDDRAPEEELGYLSDLFKQTDYIVLSSDRLYGSIPRLPWRYPIQTKFYQLLFANKLGYELVHTEQVTPELLGLKINDQIADESFTVYDHPRVDIFKKVSSLTDDQLHTLFATDLDRPLGEYTATRHGKVSDDNSLMLKEPLADQINVGDYAWNPLAQPETQWFAVLFWLVAIYLLSFSAMPLVFTMFKRLPDRGYPLAKLVGLLLVSWGVWVLASARLMPFTFWSVLLVLVLLAGLGLLAWRFGAGAEIRDFVVRKRRLILFYEGVFLAAFAAFLLIRMLNPDLWQTSFGGEKPMEYGFLNAILRSPYMPPADPFFAGGSINYYYQGQFIIACLIKLVGVDSGVAFNLAIPLLYALTFTAGACIVYNIVAWSQRRRGSTHEVSNAGMLFALLCGVLMLVIGNVHAIMQLVMINFPTTTQTFIRWGQQLGFVGPSWTSAYTQFNFWDPSRIIDGTINEFPFWSFLYADLHPHLIDMPFTLLVAGFALNLAFAGLMAPVRLLGSARSGVRSWLAQARLGLSWLWGNSWVGALTFGVMAVALGTLFAVNSWDWPTYFGITAGAVLIALLLSRKAPESVSVQEEFGDLDYPTPEEPQASRLGVWALLGTGVVSLVALALVSLASYLPFFLDFKAFFTKIIPLVDGGLIENSGGAIMQRTTLQEYIVVWAIFVFIAVSYLIYRLWNFPWSAALADLANLFPGRQPQSAKPSFSATSSFSAEPPATPRRLQRLDLAPSYATGGATSMNFARATGEEFAPSKSVTDPVPASATPVGDAINEAAITDESGTSESLAENEAGDVISSPVDVSSEGFEAQNLGSDHANVWQTEQGLPDAGMSSWVVDAHSEAQRQVKVVRADEQLGVIPLWAGFGLLMLTAAAVVLQLATQQLLLALLVALIGGITAMLLSTSRSVSALFGGLLLVTALLVSLGVEVVYLADHLQGSSMFRMNTVFKFYIQVWLLFAAGGAVAIYYIIYGLKEKRSQSNRTAVTYAGLPELATAPDGVGEHTSLETRPLAGGQSGASIPTDYANGDTTDPSRKVSPLETNWLVWSADEVEEVGNSAPIDDTEVASLVGLLPAEDGAGAGVPERATLSTRQEPDPWMGYTDSGAGDVVDSEPSKPMKPRWTRGRIAWASVFALFLLASFTFTFYGTQDRVRQRFPTPPAFGTLDGREYMKTAQYGTSVQGSSGDVPLTVNLKYDYEAINWLNDNVTGLATIAELPAEYYRADGMRAATNTGLPMVIGGLHQDEQRAGVYARLVGNRQGDMNEFFTTNDVQRALTLMSKYDIQYIYLGQLEQARAGEAGMAKFAQMADPKIGILTEVFKTTDNPPGVPGTIIYQVSTAADKDPKTLVGVPVANSGLPGISITPLPTSTPIPPPTPPVDNPDLQKLIAAVAAKPNDREARMNLVNWYRDNGFPLEAAKELETLVKQDPSNVALASQLGDMYSAAGMPDQALAAWERGRDSAPDNPDAHNKVGIAYFERKRFDDAAREFQAAVAAAPTYIESWFHLGEVYERKGDVENAKKAYQSAIQNSKEANSWQDAAQKRLNELK